MSCYSGWVFWAAENLKFEREIEELSGYVKGNVPL
jgi:hypothetical protein